jgi:hypothetical protein
MSSKDSLNLQWKWRDATDIECVVFSLWIQKEMYTFRSRFENSTLVYGYYLNDEKALIVRNKIDEPPEARLDKRKQKSGCVCINIAPSVAIKILHYLEIEPPSLRQSWERYQEDKRQQKLSKHRRSKIPTQIIKDEEFNLVEDFTDKQRLIEIITNVEGFHQLEDELKTYDLNHLNFICKWLVCHKKDRCKAIEDTLKRKDLVFTIK